jgi:hypothetical protein
MSDFNLAKSLAEARQRLAPRPTRSTRADAGRPRMGHKAREILESLLAGQERPPMRELLSQLAQRCQTLGATCPSRATVYAYLPNASGPTYQVQKLPEYARASLYNLDDHSVVSGRELAFYLFNHGDTRALSFAAGMPWLCLLQADRLRGFRPKSHALLRAVMRTRGI